MNIIHINLNYLTNFKPIFLKNLKLKKKKKLNKKIINNFFIFIILINYFKNNLFFFNCSFFIKPCFKKSYIILRAPYKNKLSRHQLLYKRYNILFSFNFYIKNKIIFNDISSVSLVFNNLFNLFIFLESNIIYQNKLFIFFSFNYFNFFLLNKYKYLIQC